MFKIGSHVGMSGKKMLVGAVEEAISYGANTFMIYTGAPQNTRRKPVEELNIEAGIFLRSDRCSTRGRPVISAARLSR